MDNQAKKLVYYEPRHVVHKWLIFDHELYLTHDVVFRLKLLFLFGNNGVWFSPN